VPVVLEELIEIVSDTDSIEQEIDHQELVKAIDEFLGTLSSDKRNIFVRGYWYFDSISEIATHFKMTPGR
jgi:RNA polymerase sigma-70 factor (ECF subfamily)